MARGTQLLGSGSNFEFQPRALRGRDPELSALGRDDPPPHIFIYQRWATRGANRSLKLATIKIKINKNKKGKQAKQGVRLGKRAPERGSYFLSAVILHG